MGFEEFGGVCEDGEGGRWVGGGVLVVELALRW